MMSNKVTYAEIIEALSRQTGFSKHKSETFTKALIAGIKAELQETGKASITNFGGFKIKDVAERQGQNPQTGEPITIPAHKRVSFTPYKALKNEVNAKYAHLETELIEEEQPTAEPEAETEPESKPGILTEVGMEPEQELEYEPEPEPKPDSELNLGRKKESEIFAPPARPRQRKKGKNTGLIMVAVLALTIIAIGSIWFFMSSDDEELASDQSAVEQTQTPEAAGSVESEAVEQEESNELEQTGNQQEEEPEVAAASQQAEETEPAEPASLEQTDNVSIYTVNEDEWYWVISRNAYGKAHFWPLIFQHNFTVNDHPDSLEKNVRLEVPALEGSPESPAKEDYRKLAAASKMVSDAYQKFGRTDKAEEYARLARHWERIGL